jgi:hypothetical protein
LRRRRDDGFKRDKIELPPRSICHLSGEAATAGSTALRRWSYPGGQSPLELSHDDRRAGVLKRGKERPTSTLSFNNGKEVVRCLIVPRYVWKFI